MPLPAPVTRTDLPGNSWLMAVTVPRSAGELGLQDDDGEQEQAADDRLPVGRKRNPAEAVLEIEDVEHHGEQQRAGQRRADRADAAGQQRAADHDRGDGEQLPAHAFGRLAGAELRGEDDAGEPGQQPGGACRRRAACARPSAPSAWPSPRRRRWRECAGRPDAARARSSRAT